jgi:hypothetical protein
MRLEWERSADSQRRIARTRVETHVAPVATRGDARPDLVSDEAFLSDLEVALDRPQTSELRAFDELTPHFKEIKDVR